LTERVGQAAVTSSQNSVLEYLKRNHGVSWSVATLRKVVAGLSEGGDYWCQFLFRRKKN